MVPLDRKNPHFACLLLAGKKARRMGHPQIIETQPFDRKDQPTKTAGSLRHRKDARILVCTLRPDLPN